MKPCEEACLLILTWVWVSSWSLQDRKQIETIKNTQPKTLEFSSNLSTLCNFFGKKISAFILAFLILCCLLLFDLPCIGEKWKRKLVVWFEWRKKGRKEMMFLLCVCSIITYILSLFCLSFRFFVFPSGYLPTFIGGVKKFFMKDSPFSVSSK